MKITEENRSYVVDSLKDLKKRISDNEVDEFDYEVIARPSKKLTEVSVRWVIKTK